MEYRRAFMHTLSVAASMRAFGENERAARLPSAVVGTASIPVLWILVRRRFGDAATLAAAAALALMPLHVAHSRSARFYAAFVLAYGIAAVIGSHALEKRSWPAVLGALVAFAAAVELQILALTLVLPFVTQAALSFWHSTGNERRSRKRELLAVAGAAASATAVIFAVPGLRASALDMLRDPVPGVRFSVGIHLNTLLIPFKVVSWWAWIPLAPLAVLGLRRAGRWGGIITVHLLVPLTTIAILYQGTGAGFSPRYLLHLLPFVATIVGVAVADGIRLGAGLVRSARAPSAANQFIAVVAATIALAGLFALPGLPSEKHPTKLIPRPNWNAAGAVIRAESRHGDALLSTSPLAMSWVTGRCGEWIREAAAAAAYMAGGRDIYCATTLVPDEASLRSYLAAHPRGWLVADPRQWTRIVDPAATALIERVGRWVDAGDPSILVYRWDLRV